MTSRDGQLQRPAAARRHRRAFTLVELLMAMMVSGVILAACVSLAWALSTYNNEGEAAVQLATHGRFAVTLLARDVREAQAIDVTDTGGLLLWMGDLNDNGQTDTNEVVLYWKPAGERVMRRVNIPGQFSIGAVGVASLDLLGQLHDAGVFVSTADGMGLGPQNEVVCRNVDSVAFYPNRAMPETLSVEYVIALSRQEDIVGDDGRDIVLTLYGAATMRAPCTEDGFEPQH